MSIVNPSGRPPVVAEVSAFDARIVQSEWDWATEHAADIAAYWARAVARNPRLFDGRVLIASRAEVRDGVLRSDHTEIPFSALDYWRKLSFPDCGSFNLFGAGIIVTRDRAVVLGRMGPSTANAGHVYFPAGTPDRDDVRGDRLDIEGSILREITEETGISPREIRASDERWAVWDGGILCCARRYDLDEDAQEVEARIAAHIALDPQSELNRPILMRSAAEEVDGIVPAYARTLVDRVLR